MTNPNDTYTSPLATRNASEEMLRIWSPRHKFQTWRRVWLAVAEATHEVSKDWGSERARSASEEKGAKTLAGASDSSSPNASGPLVTEEQVAELRAVVERGISDEEIARASELERELRHDVMAHVHCLGEQCPKAKPIIHLGCTSQDVVCNADLQSLGQAVRLVRIKIARVTVSLGRQAAAHQSAPTLGFTHYQPAQPVTVGRRIANWAADAEICERRLNSTWWQLRYRGLRGATGTQASFCKLLGDKADPRKLEAAFFDKLTDSDPFDIKDHPNESLPPYPPSMMSKPNRGNSFDITTQTYPRVVDTFVLADLASIASVLHKIATDIRLLSNRKEIDEPFGDKQIGSSAMPYKRNPMRCERICGLTRFVMNLVGNGYDTAATQWLERTLDDSSNRRLSLPESFLALDGALDLMHNVASGLVVHEKMVERNLMAELPFLATENILMAAVKAGGDRQDLHEKIRVHAQAAGHRVKHEGLDNDLLDRLKSDPAFQSKGGRGALDRKLDWDDLMDPMKYVGRSVEQTERFIHEVVEPLRERYKDELERLGESEPWV